MANTKVQLESESLKQPFIIGVIEEDMKLTKEELEIKLKFEVENEKLKRENEILKANNEYFLKNPNSLEHSQFSIDKKEVLCDMCDEYFCGVRCCFCVECADSMCELKEKIKELEEVNEVTLRENKKLKEVNEVTLRENKCCKCDKLFNYDEYEYSCKNCEREEEDIQCDICNDSMCELKDNNKELEKTIIRLEEANHQTKRINKKLKREIYNLKEEAKEAKQSKRLDKIYPCDKCEKDWDKVKTGDFFYCENCDDKLMKRMKEEEDMITERDII